MPAAAALTVATIALTSSSTSKMIGKRKAYSPKHGKQQQYTSAKQHEKQLDAPSVTGLKIDGSTGSAGWPCTTRRPCATTAASNVGDRTSAAVHASGTLFRRPLSSAAPRPTLPAPRPPPPPPRAAPLRPPPPLCPG